MELSSLLKFLYLVDPPPNCFRNSSFSAFNFLIILTCSLNDNFLTLLTVVFSFLALSPNSNTTLLCSYYSVLADILQFNVVAQFDDNASCSKNVNLLFLKLTLRLGCSIFLTKAFITFPNSLSEKLII